MVNFENQQSGRKAASCGFKGPCPFLTFLFPSLEPAPRCPWSGVVAWGVTLCQPCQGPTLVLPQPLGAEFGAGTTKNPGLEMNWLAATRRDNALPK